MQQQINNNSTNMHAPSATGEAGGMMLFAELVYQLGITTKTNDKLDALIEYFLHADDKDKVWMIALFSGRRPRRTVNSRQLSAWCADIIGIPLWLFEESYHTVGDLSETIALLIPEQDEDLITIHHSLSFYVEKFLNLQQATEEEKKDFVLQSWKELNAKERYVFNKLLSSTFRVGVSQKLVVNALAKTMKLEASVIAHRITGKWDAATTNFNDLLSENSLNIDHSKPYPFYLAYPLEEDLQTLGNSSQWQVEWKWDGIRGQIIKRNNELFVWSRGEELMTEKFPEYETLAALLPEGIVIDGEITSGNSIHPGNDFIVLPFSSLQTRIGRKTISKKQLQEAPVIFIAYDLLEYEHEDWRTRTMQERRKKLEEIINTLTTTVVHLSPIIEFDNWNKLVSIRENSRNKSAEGLMIKRKDSVYQVGRKRGDWWKWKIDPLTIDAVMIYAQKGSGRRSNLYTDYTFAVKDGDKLVSFTKAYSGLTDKEFAQVDNFVKRNSIEKFGPVRTVKPELVFEIAFEGIAASNRHKSGVALRFPRISKWRTDKKPDEINTINDLKNMLALYGK
jgi:DNA ligase 1